MEDFVMKKILIVFCLICLLLSCVSCQSQKESIKPETITFEQESYSVKEEETGYLSYTIQPDNAEYNLTWTSSDTSIVTVDYYGKITGVKAGEATITVKDANGASASCHVIVISKTAYGRLSEPAKEFVDAFMKCIKDFKNPSSVTIETITFSSSEGRWTIYVRAQNGFGGYSLAHYYLSESGSITKAPSQANIGYSDPFYNIDLINEAIQEKLQ